MIEGIGEKIKMKNNTHAGKTVYQIVWSFPPGGDTYVPRYTCFYTGYPRQPRVSVESLSSLHCLQHLA